MPDFALLTLPAANRVYGHEASRLALAELTAIAPSLHGDVRDVSIAVIGGVEYLTWKASGMDDSDRFVLSNLSSTYALFEQGEGTESLQPMQVQRLEWYDSDLITIQRYSGKTNEQFTHLLVNIAVAASAAAQERRRDGLPVRLLDPLVGRGTTLNRGLMYGFDVAGIDLDSADFEAYRTFLSTYLKDHRISHKVEDAKVRKGERAGSRRFTVRINKAQSVDVVKDDTVHAAELFGARSFDVLVADLPYGVVHGSTATGNLSRSPEELVGTSLAGWKHLLRSGAAMVLSWNTRTLERTSLEGHIAAAGFTIVSGMAAFDHKVDRSITRGVVMATI